MLNRQYYKEGIREGQQSTVQYWRKIIREAGADSENIKMHVRDRKKWRNLIDRRMKKIREWEGQMEAIHKVIKGEGMQSEGVKKIKEDETYSFMTGKILEKFVGQKQD